MKKSKNSYNINQWFQPRAVVLLAKPSPWITPHYDDWLTEAEISKRVSLTQLIPERRNAAKDTYILVLFTPFDNWLVMLLTWTVCHPILDEPYLIVLLNSRLALIYTCSPGPLPPPWHRTMISWRYAENSFWHFGHIKLYKRMDQAVPVVLPSQVNYTSLWLGGPLTFTLQICTIARGSVEMSPFCLLKVQLVRIVETTSMKQLRLQILVS